MESTTGRSELVSQRQVAPVASFCAFMKSCFSAFCLLCSTPMEEAENTVEKTLLKSREHLLRSLECEASL